MWKQVLVGQKYGHFSFSSISLSLSLYNYHLQFYYGFVKQKFEISISVLSCWRFELITKHTPLTATIAHLEIAERSQKIETVVELIDQKTKPLTVKLADSLLDH